MKLKLVEEKKFPLLNRKQIKYDLAYSTATPKGDEVKALVAKNLNVESNKIVVKRIEPFSGRDKANVLVYVYDNLESLDKYGKIHKKVKKDGKKEKTEE